MSTHRTWHFGRSDALAEISGEGTLAGFWDNVEPGQWVAVTVEHDEEAEFSWAEQPRLAAVAGVVMMVDASRTTGSQFGLVVMRDDEDSYLTGDLDYSWTRQGGLI